MDGIMVGRGFLFRFLFCSRVCSRTAVKLSKKSAFVYFCWSAFLKSGSIVCTGTEKIVWNKDFVVNVC